MPKVRGNAAKQMPDAEEDDDTHVPLEETEAAATVDNKPEEDDVTAEGAPLDAIPGTSTQQEDDSQKEEAKDDGTGDIQPTIPGLPDPRDAVAVADVGV